jgi:hypothetical protein
LTTLAQRLRSKSMTLVPDVPEPEAAAEPTIRAPGNVQVARHGLAAASAQRDLAAAELNLRAAQWRIAGEGPMTGVRKAEIELARVEKVVAEARRVLASALAAWSPKFAAERAARYQDIEAGIAKHAQGITEAYASLWELTQEFTKQGLEAPAPAWLREALAAKEAAGALLGVIEDLQRQRARR